MSVVKTCGCEKSKKRYERENYLSTIIASYTERKQQYHAVGRIMMSLAAMKLVEL